MEYRRYGKFQFLDYMHVWCPTILLLAFAIAAILYTPSYLVIGPCLMVIYLPYTVLEPNRERFTIINNSIVTRKGRKTKTIELPDELTLIVSDADILDSFSKNRLGSYKSNTLKGRYAISILRRDSAENVIRYLHKNGAREYSNTSIERSFCSSFRVEEYIYSFVYNQAAFDTLISGRKCQLIIPKSLLKAIAVDSTPVDVRVDESC